MERENRISYWIGLTTFFRRALSQFSFGQSNRTPDIQNRGEAEYGKCIVTLRVEIQSGSRSRNGGDGTTAAPAASASKVLPSGGGHWLICPILIMTMVAVS